MCATVYKHTGEGGDDCDTVPGRMCKKKIKIKNKRQKIYNTGEGGDGRDAVPGRKFVDLHTQETLGEPGICVS